MRKLSRILQSLALFLLGLVMCGVAHAQSAVEAGTSGIQDRIAAKESELAGVLDSHGRTKVEIDLAQLLILGGQNTKAEGILQKALGRCRRDSFPIEEIDCLIRMGTLNNNISRFDKAQQYFNQALLLAEKQDDPLLVIRCINGLSYISFAGGEPASSVLLLERALKLAEPIKARAGYPILLSNLAYLYGETGDLAKARSYYEQAIQCDPDTFDDTTRAYLHVNLGELFRKEGKTSEAIAHLNQGLTLLKTLGNHRGMLKALIGLAGAFRIENRLQEARACVVELDELLPKMEGLSEFNVRIVEEKALQHAAFGEWAEAYQDSRLHTELAKQEQQLLQQIKAKQEGIRLEQKFRSEQLLLLENERLKLEQALEQSGTRLHMLYWMDGVLLLSGVVVFYGIRAKLRAEQREHEVTASARETAESSAALKTRLLRMVAHDLRSPLLVIIMSADLIVQGIKNPIVASGTIRDAARKMNELLENLLSQAISDEGVLRVKLEKLEMRSFLEESSVYFSFLLKRKQQVLVLNLQEGAALCVQADPIRLWQVLENLVSNASKFSPAQSEIRIVVMQSGEFLRIGVSDAGPGISEQEKARLFKPFVRGNARPTGGERSTGLGLSIAKEIMDLHHGRIVVESGAKGGSTFWIELPSGPAAG